MSVYKFTVLGLLGGEANQNVFHIQHDAMTPTILDEWALFYQVQWEANLQPFLSNQYDLNRYAYQRVDLPEQPMLEYDFPGTNVGDLTEHPTASQNAVQANMRATTIRPNRARKYFGGFTERDCTAFLWLPDLVDAVREFMYTLMLHRSDDPTNNAGYVTVRYDPETAAVEAWNDLSVATVSNIPSALGRRKRGRGA